jgi:hypothetical protein
MSNTPPRESETEMGKTEFTTRQFERTHGRKPKGFGAWAFQATTSETAFDSELTGSVQFFTGTFTEARAEAKQAFEAPLVAVLG